MILLAIWREMLKMTEDENRNLAKVGEDFYEMQMLAMVRSTLQSRHGTNTNLLHSPNDHRPHIHIDPRR